MTICSLTRMVCGVEAMSGRTRREWRTRVREAQAAVCPRCGTPVTRGELDRNCGVCVTCCIESETDTFVFDTEPPTH